MARQISIRERRARLARRHHLAPRDHAGDPVDVATDLVALHATDAATVHLAAAARLRPPETTGPRSTMGAKTANPATPVAAAKTANSDSANSDSANSDSPDSAVTAVEQALYDDRTLIRMLGMRRTVFVVPRASVPVIQAACTDAVAAANRRRLSQLLIDSAITSEPAKWLTEVGEQTLAVLAEQGEATGTELAALVPGLRTQVTMAAGKSYAATVNLTSRILVLLGSEGHIVRGRPRGTWLSSQHRWSTMAAWLPGGLPVWTATAARTELARQWLRAYGPAPVADLRWWAGWGAGETKKALAGLDVVEVAIEGGGTGVLLAGDTAVVPDPEPWIALLPALDPTVMGWLEREWFFGPHAPALFDRTGNPGPTVWVDGRVVGGWAQHPDGEVRYRLLEDTGTETAEHIGQAAEELGVRLGPVRVTPRFRTPLERELSG